MLTIAPNIVLLRLPRRVERISHNKNITKASSYFAQTFTRTM